MKIRMLKTVLLTAPMRPLLLRLKSCSCHVSFCLQFSAWIEPQEGASEMSTELGEETWCDCWHLGASRRHAPTLNTESVFLGASQGESTAAIFAFHFHTTFHQYPSVSRSIQKYPFIIHSSYFQHFEFHQDTAWIRTHHEIGSPCGPPSAQHRCPPGAAWWGAHVDSSRVASKYLAAGFLKRSRGKIFRNTRK